MANLQYGSANSPGPYGPAVGWVDFSPVPTLNIGQSYTLTATAPGTANITFTLTCRGPIAQTQVSGSGKMGAVYYGVGGNTSFGSTRDNSNTMTIDITGLSVVSLTGTPIPYYKIIMMDAETTVDGEFWQIQTNGGAWTYEGISPVGSSMGDPSISGLNTSIYKQTGIPGGGGNTSPIVSSVNPSQITFSSQNNATQLFSLGLYIPESVSITKAVDKTYTVTGDTLTYTIIIKNPGYTTINNIFLTDQIPAYTSYINNSLIIGTVPNSGDITTGVTIPTLLAQTSITVTFKVKIYDTIPVSLVSNIATIKYTGTSGSTILNSNRVNTYVNEAKVSISKDDDTNIAKPGDIIVYTLVIQNTGTTIANGVYIYDTIPVGTVFVDNSITIDSITQSAAVITPPTGLSIGTLNTNITKTITFKVEVVSVPPNDLIINSGDIKYNYLVNPTSTPISEILNSNLTTIPVKYVEVSTYKYVDKDYATQGDILNYTITIPNKGNVPAIDVFLIDTLPDDVIFIPTSLRVNDIYSTDSLTHLNIGTIPAYGIATITFQVRIP